MSYSRSLLSPPPRIVLPIADMDVEVLERYIARVLTTLHRLVIKIDFEMDLQGVRHRRELTDERRTSLWSLLRRVTRRVERLRCMGDIIGEKLSALGKEKRHLAQQRVECKSERLWAFLAKKLNALEGDVCLAEALQSKIIQSIERFERTELLLLTTLCAA